MWQRTTIGGKPIETFTPDAGPYEGAILFLHGHREESLRDHPAFVELFERYRLPVIAPCTGPSWWLDRIAPDFDRTLTPMQFVRGLVTDWVQENWQVAPPRIALLGISMGGQGALNLAYRQGLRYPIVAAISPTIDFHLIHGRGFGVEDLFDDAESARQETAILHLHPLNWPKYQFFCSDPQDRFWHDGCERLASKLSSSGVPFECDLRTSHGGHGWEYFDAMAEKAVTFIAESLKKLG